MKVLMLNGSPKAKGNTAAALEEIGKQGLDLLGVIPQDEDVY